MDVGKYLTAAVDSFSQQTKRHLRTKTQRPLTQTQRPWTKRRWSWKTKTPMDKKMMPRDQNMKQMEKKEGYWFYHFVHGHCVLVHGHCVFAHRRWVLVHRRCVCIPRCRSGKRYILQPMVVPNLCCVEKIYAKLYAIIVKKMCIFVSSRLLGGNYSNLCVFRLNSFPIKTLVV